MCSVNYTVFTKTVLTLPFMRQSAYVKCVKIFLDIVSFIVSP